MTIHRADCKDCQWSFEDGDFATVSDEMERHARKEVGHYVELERAIATDGRGTVQADATPRLTDDGLEMPEFLKGHVGSFTLRTADITGTYQTTDHGMPEDDFYDGPIAVYPDDDGDYNAELGAGFMALATPEHGEEIFEVLDERSQDTENGQSEEVDRNVE